MALYHSTKGSVNYTVVGSPTIVDGIASGFAGGSKEKGNYLKTQSLPDFTGDVEIVIKFKTDAWVYGMLMSWIVNGYSCYVNINALGKAACYFSRTGADSTNLNLEASSHSFAFTAGQDCYLKVTKTTEGTLTMYHSNDGQTYTQFATKTNANYGTSRVSSYFRIGINASYNPGNPFNGSIDLKETYIKVNGQPWFGVCPVEVQKHQLMGPVGYTVVGSPTIVDGVASGFSGSNYIKTSQNYTQTNNELKLHCTFVSSSQQNNAYTIIGNASSGSNRGFAVSCEGNNKMGFGFSETGSSWQGGFHQVNYTIEPSTKYDVEYDYYPNKKIVLRIKKHIETVWNTFEETITGFMHQQSSPIVLGNEGLSSRTNFPQSIDLNETYIKVNGKLWFYQPADTKYIVKDGKLVWADPRIYLDNSNTTTRNYFSLQTLPENDTYKVYVRVRPSLIKNNGILTVNSTNRFVFVLGYNGPMYARIFGSSHTAAGVNYVANDLIEMTASKEGFFGNVAGTSFNVAPAVTPDFSSPATSALLLNAGSGSAFPNDFLGKFYATKIWSNGVLCEDVVPVPAGLKIGSFTVPSNGLFDMVKQQFYPNQGAETLPIGRDE